MLKLAEQFAQARGTRVIAHRMDGNAIVFVLESGQKYRMTEGELAAALKELLKDAAAEEHPKAARKAK